LPVGRGAKGPQVARGDPEARERLARLRDLGVRLRVDALAALDPRLEQAELLELPRALRADARSLAEALEVETVLLLAERGGPAPAPLLPRPGGQLLADHAQRQELVAPPVDERAVQAAPVLDEPAAFALHEHGVAP